MLPCLDNNIRGRRSLMKQSMKSIATSIPYCTNDWIRIMVTTFYELPLYVRSPSSRGLSIVLININSCANVNVVITPGLVCDSRSRTVTSRISKGPNSFLWVTFPLMQIDRRIIASVQSSLYQQKQKRLGQFIQQWRWLIFVSFHHHEL